MNGEAPDYEALCRLQCMKTGALMEAACLCGYYAALNPAAGMVPDTNIENALCVYAHQLGLAFQITDDLLDVTGDATFGKPIGSDAKNGKVTALTFLTAEEAEGAARAATEAAIQAVGPLPDSEILCRLAGFLLERRR